MNRRGSCFFDSVAVEIPEKYFAECSKKRVSKLVHFGNWLGEWGAPLPHPL
jgi:hypothetical protein